MFRLFCFLWIGYVVVAEDILYVIGGKHGEFGSTGVNTVEVSNSSAKQFNMYPAMTTGRISSAAVAINKKIYVIGGMTYRVGYDDGEVVDTAAANPSWAPFPTMSTIRESHAAVAINGSIYVMGGMGDTDFAHVPQILKTVETITPSDADPTWKPYPSMSTPRSPVFAVTVNSKIFVMGGFDQGDFIQSTEVLDTSDTSPHWKTTELVNTKLITSLFAVGNNIYALHNDTTMDVLDATVSPLKWAPFPANMLSPRCFYGTAVVGSRVYVASGVDCTGHTFPFPHLSTVDVLDLASPSPAWQHFANLTDGPDRETCAAVGMQN